NPGNDFLETTIKAANDYSVEYRMYDSATLSQAFPAIKIHHDEVAYFETSGGFLRPEKCIDVQLKLARANGAQTMCNTEVVSIHEASDGVVVGLDDGSTVTASKVILSQGPWVS